MEIIRLSGVLAFAHRRVRALGQSASGACIPYVTGFGILLAFALLCSLSSHADATPSIDAAARSQGMDHAGPIAVLPVHDAVVAGTGRNEVADRASAGGAGGFDVASVGERGLVRDGIVSGVDHAAATWCAWLAVSFTLVALTVISFSGWCRARFTLKRAVEKVPWPFVTSEPVDVSGDGKDSAFALCQRLAHRMGGELAVSSEPGFGTCRTFSTPFAVERTQTPLEMPMEPLMEPPMEPAQRDDQTSPAQAGTAPLEASSAEPLREQFDRNYLAALADEGIELHAFMRGWYQSIDDDLKRMHELCERHDVDGVRESLHRLSGAVGLVGARSLMEALRSTSAAKSEPDADVVHALAQRVESLKRHLDSAIDPPRSNLQ